MMELNSKQIGVLILTILLTISITSCGGNGNDNGNGNVTGNGVFSLTDLEGIWEINGLASGDGAPWWQRGTLVINLNGSFSASLTKSDGSTETSSGTFDISSDGIITLQNSPNFRGSMDLGKTIIVGTDTWLIDGPGTTEIKVITKKADIYALSDLEGTWEINALASGGGAPWWERGTLIIDPNGSFSASVTESDGSSGNPSGTFNISNDGIITMSGNPDFRGSLDYGKRVMVWTDTWSTGSPGTTEIKVATKKVAGYQ